MLSAWKLQIKLVEHDRNLQFIEILLRFANFKNFIIQFHE